MTEVTVPVTGPASDYNFDAPPTGHIDRTAEVRRIGELGLRYAYEFARLALNLRLDVKTATDDLRHLHQTHEHVNHLATDATKLDI